MPLSALPPFLTALLYLIVGIFVLSRVQAGKKKVAYSLWLFTTVYWQMGWAIDFTLQKPTWVPFIIHLNYSGIVFIPIAFYQLFIAFLDARKDYRWLKLCYGIGILFSAACWIDHWMVGGVFHYPWGYYARAGRFHPLYILFLILIVSRILVLLFQKQPGTPASNSDPRQLKLLRWAFILYLPASFDFAVNYGLRCYPIGFIFTLISLGLVSYAIVKHQLFNIRLIIQKTLIYSTATLSLTAIYVAVLVFMAKILEGWVGAPNVYSSAIAAVVIAVLFHPVRSRIQVWMDRHFPRESLNQEILREATGRFVHEIKRPLANISMPAQLALLDLEQAMAHPQDFERMAPKLRDRMKYIVDESLKAGQKIEAIQQISSQTSTPQNTVDLGKLLESLLEQERPRFLKEKIDLTVAGIRPGMLTLGDSVQIEIALANVIKNAIDALVRVDSTQLRRLSVRMSDDPAWIAIEIEDSGDGIPEADLPRLFDPWFSTKGSGGMGIGLYLTREILRLHGARIDVKSRPGTTVFRITFPSRIINL